jgi:hypothetical protein
MVELEISVNAGAVTVTGNEYQIVHLQSAIAEILHLNPSVSLTSVSFHSVPFVAELSPRQRSIVHFLLPDVPVDAPIDSLRAIPTLALDLLEPAASLKSLHPASFTHDRVSIPLPLASFLVEVFAAYQDTVVVHRINKRFNSDPIFTLLLPVPIPVKFSLATNTEVLLSLADPLILPLARTGPLLDAALNALSHRPFKTVTFSHVDIEGFDTGRQTLFGKKNGVALVKGEDELHSDESRTFTFWVTPVNSTDFGDTLNDAVERAYWQINRRECIECRKPFSDVSNEPCVQSAHAEGCKQLPFEDGSFEKFDPATQQTFVRWSCAPQEVPIDDNGCLEVIVNELHVAAGDADLSRMEVLNGALFLTRDRATE